MRCCRKKTRTGRHSAAASSRPRIPHNSRRRADEHLSTAGKIAHEYQVLQLPGCCAFFTEKKGEQRLLEAVTLE